MGLFLNSRNSYENFRELVQDTYFVDKSLIIQELIPSFGKKTGISVSQGHVVLERLLSQICLAHSSANQ